jgi:SAM-dependent methyltransferase
MSEDNWPGIVVNGATGQLVAGDEAAGAPCWEPHQQERRWSATATVLAALRDSLPAGRQPSRAVDLGCGTGDLTVRIASLWPGAEILAVDHSLDMTLLTEASAHAAGHRNVRTINADVSGDLGIEPGSVDLVVASCIANNMLIDFAGPCTRGDVDTVGYATWYHAWDSRSLPLLKQARRLLSPGGFLLSVEPNNNESAIVAWARMLARAGFAIAPELSKPGAWECDCGCSIPLLVLQPRGEKFGTALGSFIGWLKANGHAFYGSTVDLRPDDADALAALAGDPLVDLRYRVDGTDITIRAAEFAPFLVCQYGGNRQLLPGSAVALLADDVIERLKSLQVLDVEPDLTGSLAATLLAAARR